RRIGVTIVEGQDRLRVELITELVVGCPAEAVAVRHFTAIVQPGKNETGVGGETLGPAITDRIVSLPVEVFAELAIRGETVGIVRLKFVGDEIAAAQAKALAEAMVHIETKASLTVDIIHIARAVDVINQPQTGIDIPSG